VQQSPAASYGERGLCSGLAFRARIQGACSQEQGARQSVGEATQGSLRMRFSTSDPGHRVEGPAPIPALGECLLHQLSSSHYLPAGELGEFCSWILFEYRLSVS